MKVLSGRIHKIDRREVLRYLGYTPSVRDMEGVNVLIDECESLVLQAQDLKAVYSLFDVSRGDMLDLGFARTSSRDLEKYLSGCDRLALFAATAGAGIDRLIARYNRLSPARAAVVQALGAALVEQWCDEVHAGLTAQYGANTARFSCGFGDLPLSLQRDIFAALDVTKKIGVTLSDDCFMTPTKSVTAIVGIKNDVQAKA